MGRISQDQGQLFYSFCLEEVVPDDHLVRGIASVLDLSWVRAELAPHYSHAERPSIDPGLMIRMLIIGYVFAIRSERALCREIQLNLAYRWFCGLGIEDSIRAALTGFVRFTRARRSRAARRILAERAAADFFFCEILFDLIGGGRGSAS